MAPKAVVHLLHGMHAEGRRLFLMEGAKPGEILAGLFQANVLADHADDVRRRLTVSANEPVSATFVS